MKRALLASTVVMLLWNPLTEATRFAAVMNALAAAELADLPAESIRVELAVDQRDGGPHGAVLISRGSLMTGSRSSS